MALRASKTSDNPEQYRLPCGDLLESRDDYINICVRLYNASINGDWETARTIFQERPELIRYSISDNRDTALHIAASTKSTRSVEAFVKNLVGMMSGDDLKLQNQSGNTAMCLAAATGNLKSAEIMWCKDPEVTRIYGAERRLPLYFATLFGQREMARYLFHRSNMMDDTGLWNDEDRNMVLEKCVEANIFDVALKIVKQKPHLGKNGNVLRVLAKKTDVWREELRRNFIWSVILKFFAFILNFKVRPADKPSEATELLRIIWGNIVKLQRMEIDEILRGPPDDPTTCDKDSEDALELHGTISKNIVKLPFTLQVAIRPRADPTRPLEGRELSTQELSTQKYSSHALFVAAELGNTEFLVEILRQYPDLIWKKNDDNQYIFHVAVSHRHAGIYTLLYEIGSAKEMIISTTDKQGNNMLHLAAKRAKKNGLRGDVSGVALQMQRELAWYKEVETMMPLSFREKKNNDGLLPGELFTEEHKDLVATSEKWMKSTASQCMVVAALIATVVFAAAFTVPGGYNQDTGYPMFLYKRTLVVFVISDAISLTFSTISIFIFLSILTSRYAEQDFLDSLPKKLMKGLATLFISIAAMMVTFTVCFYLILIRDKMFWVPKVITLLASIPVFLYARLQYRLLVDVFRSTYSSKHLFKPKKLKLYYRPPTH